MEQTAAAEALQRKRQRTSDLALQVDSAGQAQHPASCIHEAQVAGAEEAHSATSGCARLSRRRCRQLGHRAASAQQRCAGCAVAPCGGAVTLRGGRRRHARQQLRCRYAHEARRRSWLRTPQVPGCHPRAGDPHLPHLTNRRELHAC